MFWSFRPWKYWSKCWQWAYYHKIHHKVMSSGTLSIQRGEVWVTMTTDKAPIGLEWGWSSLRKGWILGNICRVAECERDIGDGQYLCIDTIQEFQTEGTKFICQFFNAVRYPAPRPCTVENAKIEPWTFLIYMHICIHKINNIWLLSAKMTDSAAI